MTISLKDIICLFLASTKAIFKMKSDRVVVCKLYSLEVENLPCFIWKVVVFRSVKRLCYPYKKVRCSMRKYYVFHPIRRVFWGGNNNCVGISNIGMLNTITHLHLLMPNLVHAYQKRNTSCINSRISRLEIGIYDKETKESLSAQYLSSTIR